MLNAISNIDVLIGFAIVIAMVIYGILSKGHKNEEEYFVASRKVGPFILSGTMAAGVVGGGILLIFSGFTYRYGIGAFSIFAGISLGLLLLSPIAKAYKSLVDKNHFYSLPDLFTYKWGNKSGALASIIIFIWSLGFILLQLSAAGKLLSILIPISYVASVTITALLVLSYVLLNGFVAVIKTDVIQYGATLLFFAILAFFVIPKPEFKLTDSYFTTMSIADIIGFFILGFFNIIT